LAATEQRQQAGQPQPVCGHGGGEEEWEGVAAASEEVEVDDGKELEELPT
jgi:hypothetical protein